MMKQPDADDDIYAHFKPWMTCSPIKCILVVQQKLMGSWDGFVVSLSFQSAQVIAIWEDPWVECLTGTGEVT